MDKETFLFESNQDIKNVTSILDTEIYNDSI